MLCLCLLDYFISLPKKKSRKHKIEKTLPFAYLCLTHWLTGTAKADK
jgi:hypothetical protein